jgi:hypothetical protein
MRRVVCAVLGIAFLALSVLIRYSLESISAGHWKIFFRFGHPSVSNWIVVPLPLLMAFTAASCLSLLLIPTVRQAGQNLIRSPRKLIWVAGAMLVWLLTMAPLDVAKDPPFLTDQVTYVYILLGSLGVLFLLLGLSDQLEFAGRLVERGYELLLKIPARTLIWSCAGFVFVAANVVSGKVFHHIPHIQDTVAQLFQARLFAQGRLFVASPPYPQFFDIPQIINNGHWYSQYPFGHPLLLMLGVLVGAPWIINPLLGALSAVVIYYVGREIYDEALARVGIVLATLSPYLLFMSSEFMSHSSALLFAALFLLFYARAMDLRRDPGSGGKRATDGGRRITVLAALAGLSMGVVADIRPFTGLLLVAPFALDAGVRLLRDWRRYWRRVAVMIGAGAVMVALLLLYNYLTNGDPLRFGYVVKWGKGHEIGFGHSGWGQPYTLARALVGNSIELYGLNRYLFEFPIPSLAFIILLFAAGTRKRWDWLLVGTVVSLTVGYFFYWWHSILFGPRWQYEALPALVLLTARGMRAIPGFLETTLQTPIPRERVRRWLGKLLFVCYASMLVVAMPARIGYYLRYGFGILHTTMATIGKANVHNAIVFTGKYEETFLQNSIPPGGDIVYARDLGPLNLLLTRQFPARACYLAQRDTLREFRNPDFENSPVKAGLDSIVRALDTTDLSGYRTLFWPAEELKSMVAGMASRQRLPVTSYRELGQKSVGDVKGLAGYLPALAAWVVNDRSDGLAIFTFMDRRTDLDLGPYRFHHLATFANGRVTLFEIRRRRTAP